MVAGEGGNDRADTYQSYKNNKIKGSKIHN